MKNVFVTLLLLLTLFACNKALKPEEIEQKLKESMSEYLNHSPENNAAGTSFVVKDVTYYPAREFYECEFTVEMKRGNTDTTGIMKAKVSPDFSKVIRRL
ncbi:hypothetical protein [Sediminibacterium soli]|uniref:hypothetical protein n=1 Tax=Sediminibacterium soli TaxID=2698829 RepID=UPI00137AC58D|nr:hypothetical protein [Sediminibacterium soli]NCI47124.1 hypothetical protein [Sediminibacterium soli]